MTYIILFLTCAVSIACFYVNGLFDKLSLRPYLVWHKRQWWRVISHGFVHGDFTHLFVNMIVLYSFGRAVERIFGSLEQAATIGSATSWFLWLYFGGMVFASLYDIFARRGNYYFASVGASGAVSAVIFTSIFFGPMQMVYFFGIIPIPGIIFGVLYLLYESYMARKQQDRVNHYAHILGAVYGFIFPLLMDPALIQLFLRGFTR